MSLTLRPYQAEMLEGIRVHFRAKVRNVCAQLPTGGGKTALVATMFQSVASKGMRGAFGVHRSELLHQAMLTFDKVGVRYGVVSPHHPGNVRAPIQLISIPTWTRRVQRLGRFDFISWDESHHVAASTWAKLHEAQPGAYHVGLTATPQRLDGRGLRDFFAELVCGPQMRALIESGYLCKYRYFEPTIATVDEHGKTRLVGDAVTQYQRIARGRKALYFCKSVEHSKEVAAAFNAAGVPAVHVDGDTHHDDRVRYMRAFRAGEAMVMTNVEIACEGLDVPDIQCVGLLRRTESLTMYLQMVGRGLRPADGKQDCILLDHCGLRGIHGLPDDERQWTLDGAMGMVDGKPAPAKRCPICYAMTYAGAEKCKECGHVFVSMSKMNIRQVDGDLEEVAAEAARVTAAREQGMARDVEGLVQLGRLRGYKDPEAWARAILDARKNPGGKRQRRMFA